VVFNGREMRKAVCTFTCDVVVATSEATSATNMVANSVSLTCEFLNRAPDVPRRFFQ
jgi:hypothetical protein